MKIHTVFLDRIELIDLRIQHTFLITREHSFQAQLIDLTGLPGGAEGFEAGQTDSIMAVVEVARYFRGPNSAGFSPGGGE